MSTHIVDIPKKLNEGGKPLSVTRFCGPAGLDRIRMQIRIGDEFHILDRQGWATLVWLVNRGFDEFPV